jgi:hypothetical protein
MNNKKLKELGGCIELPTLHSPEPPTPQPQFRTNSACSRCKDVHIAQRSGLTTSPCVCDCHLSNTTSTSWAVEHSFPPQKFSNTGDAIFQ